jgi:hypothetical protein
MPNLYMFLLGCRPPGRKTEQHDVFFAIGESIAELVPEIKASWPEVKGNLHVDAWRQIRSVNGFSISVTETQHNASSARLFFINLGGYKQDEFEEFHYKTIIAANTKGEAILQAKQTAFYKHTGFAGAPSHIDDRYGIDVDDVYEIADILPESTKQRFSILVSPVTENLKPDFIHLGYFKLDAVDKWGREV